jgi:prepilin-type processing-associated H-X9-DG protein
MKRGPRLMRWLGVNSGGKPTLRAHAQAGSGLLQLLFVIAIILLVFVLYWGGSANNQAKSKKLMCRENLEKLYIPLQIYANEHNDAFPDKPGAQTSEEVLDVLVPKYNTDTDLFICPGSKDQPIPSGESIAKRKISYAYYMGRRAGNASDALMSDAQIDTLPKTTGQPIFSADGKPPGNNHKSGGNFLFSDGHTDSSSPMSSFLLATNSKVVLLNP